MLRVSWQGQGEAWVMSVEGEAIVLSSTRPYAPGSRPEGRLESGSELRMKTHRCRRESPDAEPLRYRLEGRLLSATRELRAELAARLAPEADGA